jgi:two-component system, chemotaxis family, chemotaxis protein CheY
VKVLIVDDSIIIRGAIENWLGDLDLEIVGRASNGKEAVELAGSLRPDIITMDITMPEMDGLTAIEHVLDIHPEARIIVVSALAGRETALTAIKKGAVSFLVKPFTKDELHEVFEEVMEDA